EWLNAGPGERSAKSMLRLAIPYAIVGTVYFVIRLRILSGVAEMGGKLSAIKTFYTLPIAFWWYVKQTLWPFGLSLYYPEMIVRTPSLPWFVLPAVAAVIAVAGYAWFTRRSRLLQFLGLWFLLTLAPPVATVLLLQPHARYLYLPTFAFAVMVAL